ncbi:T9SS sorting signal type C domain-containing protein [Flavobacterium sp.]|uniref:T9SS sorting signal type C domain-containing protein n=1 Tax=Flavobacterium sp. TaxID=239 RepID=UPI0025B93AAC|nr:T9SS sorting signal type C domain-containing protein [Flavobacterium sp.]MBA4277535.1 hypothetical protein [Flavobacterium sp.]
MRLKLLFVTIALFIGFGSYGQSILTNPLTFSSTVQSSPYSIGQTTDLNINSTGISRGSGINGVAALNRYTADGWNSLSLNANDYFEFTLTPNPGYKINFFNFVYTAQASGTGATSFAFRSSLDGYNADIGTPSATGTTISLSAGLFQNITSAITFRIYGWNASASGGTFSINDFTFNGNVSSIGPYSITSGDWNTPATWSTNLVPVSTDNVTISAGHTVYTSSSLTRTGTTTVNGSFQLNSGGYASGNNFTYGATGTLNFNGSGSYGVSNTDVFWPSTSGPFNVNVLQGGVTLNSANRTVAGTFATAAGVTLTSSTLTLNGTAQINGGGFFNQSPIYGSASTLIYNIGGVSDYGRGNEWQALGVGTIGTTPGYPNNVKLSGNTTLNYNNGTPLAKAINGNLTIDSGSSFYMDYGGGASGGVLTVAGNLINNGNLTLGNAVGDDLKLGGNFTNTGTFNGNSRAVFFTKNGTQIVSSVSALTIPYIVFQPVSGSTTVQLLSDLIVSAPNAGNAISFSSATDVFDLNSKTLTIGTAGVANVINGSGTFKGTITSNLTLLGTGSIGTLTFASNLNLGTLTMNRQAATVGCTMGSDVTINTALNLTNGLIDLGANTMTLEDVVTTNGASSNSFVIADMAGSIGILRKRYTTSYPSFTFPIGDRIASTDGAQYSPATISFSSATTYSATAYINVAVNDIIHPNIDSSTDYITRYWSVYRSGAFTNPNFTFTGTYLPIDIVGTESNSVSASWNGTKWTNGSTISLNTLIISAVTDLPVSTPDNHFSAGNRNREINIKGLTGGTNNIVNGSSTANGLNNTLFAATSIGSSTTKDYEIQNLGIAALNLTGAPIVSIGGVNPGDFTVTTVPSTTVVGGSSTSFVITFSPTMTGTRTATISISNNDSDENPYTFLIQGTGNCATAAVNTITPTSGPVGTEVTINATSNNLTGATASFNGVAATSITYVSATQIKVIIPSGATSGNIVTTNATGCQATNAFTVVDNKANSCQGGTNASDLFISEVTDSNWGGLTYLEIYNGTGVSKNLSGYSINTASNGGTYSGTPLNLSNVTLASGSTYIVALGDDNLCTTLYGDGSLASQSTTNLGVNFKANENDHIALFNGATKIDSWGEYGNANWATSSLSIFATETNGVTFRRKNTATLPSTAYDNSDWDIIDFVGTNKEDCSNNDYTDIGTYNFISGTPPTVTIPSYTSTCKTATLTVSGTEGYNGTAPADTKELAYQWFVSAPGATGWTEITDNTNYTGSLTATLSIANISTVINYQYYCQIRENTNTCYTASNAVKIIDGTITWNGTDWRDVNNAITTPSISKLAVINADYDTSVNGSFSACSVVVNTSYTLTITANEYVKIQNDLTNNGYLDIEDDGSLVQVSDSGINTGSISYERITPPIFRTDYTYWSSPVANYTLGGVSQNLTLWDKYYSYDSSAETWKQESSATSMLAGIGYIIRGPESPFLASFDAFFTGVPNNGVYSIPNVAEDKSYLLGNPYPSALDADAFLDANSAVLDGTLYFWTHKTPMNLAENIPNPGLGWAYTYSLDDYAAYNPVGGIGINDVAFSSGGSPAPNGSEKPTGKIASGQGFFASSKAITSGTTIVYNNSMRVDNINESILNNSQFFKTRNPATKTALLEKHRIWLNLKNPQGAFKQTLIGYITNATNGYDSRFDGETFDANEFVDFYSVNQDKNLVIQGRALPFNENDEVPLGFRTSIEGPFTINIDQVDGALANQAVFIEDKLMNTVFDLKSGNYTFNTVAGTFNDRFILRYTNKTLGTTDIETKENHVLVSTKNKQIKVNSAVEIMDKILVYDLLGRELFKKEKVNSNELTLTNFTSSHQTLLVKVSLQNGQVVTKKIIY